MPPKKFDAQREHDSTDEEYSDRGSSDGPYASTAPSDYALSRQPTGQLAPSESRDSCSSQNNDTPPTLGNLPSARGRQSSTSDPVRGVAVTDNPHFSDTHLPAAPGSIPHRPSRPRASERAPSDRGRSQNPRSTPPLPAADSHRNRGSQSQSEPPHSEIPTIRLPSPEYLSGRSRASDNSSESQPSLSDPPSSSVESAEAGPSQDDEEAQGPLALSDPSNTSAPSEGSSAALQTASQLTSLDRLRQSADFRRYAHTHLSPPESLPGGPPPSVASDRSPTDPMSSIFEPDPVMPLPAQLADRLTRLQESQSAFAPGPSNHRDFVQNEPPLQNGSAEAFARRHEADHAKGTHFEAGPSRRPRMPRRNSPRLNPSLAAGPSRHPYSPRTPSPLSNGSISPPHTNGLPTRESLGYTTGLENRSRYLSPTAPSTRRAPSPLQVEIVDEDIDEEIDGDFPPLERANDLNDTDDFIDDLPILNGVPVAPNEVPDHLDQIPSPSIRVTARSRGIPPLPDDMSESDWVREQCATGPQPNRSLLTPSVAESSDPTECLEMALSAPRVRLPPSSDADSREPVGGDMAQDSDRLPVDNDAHGGNERLSEHEETFGHDTQSATIAPQDRNEQPVDTASIRGGSSWRSETRRLTASSSPFPLSNDMPLLRPTLSSPADMHYRPFSRRPSPEWLPRSEPIDLAGAHLFRPSPTLSAGSHPIVVVTMDGRDPTVPRVISTELLSAPESRYLPQQVARQNMRTLAPESPSDYEEAEQRTDPYRENPQLLDEVGEPEPIQHRLPIEQPPPELREAFLWSLEQQAARALTAEHSSSQQQQQEQEQQLIQQRQTVAQPPEPLPLEEEGVMEALQAGLSGRRDTVGDLELDMEPEVKVGDGEEEGEVAREEIV